ncbi:MAG: hypothetical protein A2X59_11030 [Nitrospirae bacterium GWC2_42_7]|nr:MAG: hypothetical protein A2X59_11030 [Nitrospirae bacterium GWC2_42_7]
MKTDRKAARFIRRLETEFTAENKSYRGISSDLSLSGLFIRTAHAFVPGSMLDITLHLPDGQASILKGKVMRAFKTHMVALKNGMGVFLVEKDSHYINFMKTHYPDIDEEPTSGKSSFQTATTNTKPEPEPEKKPDPQPADFLVLACSKCGTKNKVNRSKISLGPKCGKCGSPLVISLS